MKITKFEDLAIWRLSLKITKQIYDLTAASPFNRDFGLRDQIRRAIISVSSNIVEGFEKNNNNELARFLKIAKGSTGEVRNQLYIALAVGYIKDNQFRENNVQLEALASQIGKFISYLNSRKKENPTRNK